MSSDHSQTTEILPEQSSVSWLWIIVTAAFSAVSLLLITLVINSGAETAKQSQQEQIQARQALKQMQIQLYRNEQLLQRLTLQLDQVCAKMNLPPTSMPMMPTSLPVMYETGTEDGADIK